MTDIEELYNQYKAHNDAKNKMKAVNTPITLLAMWVALYMFSQVV